VALTFDAGSDCGNTTAILDTLAANHITGTFGLTGQWVEQCAAQAQRIGRDGHAVMNHSYSHPSFTGISTDAPPVPDADIADQLARAEAAIVSATGRNPQPFFRPPYGDRDARVDAAVGRAGYRYAVLWTVDSKGWKGVPPEQVVSNVLAEVGNGAIVLMHVGTGSTDADALQRVIDGIRGRGLGFAALAQVL
jgi:peptidoglycan-N-acetylglucosamine deacetylase